MNAPKPESVAEYLAAQAPPVRAILKKVRSAVKKGLPKASEVIAYGIPSYQVDGRSVLHFAGWKAHYAVYPATEAMLAVLAKSKAPHQVVKATIRFPLDRPVPEALLTQLAKLSARRSAPSAESDLPAQLGRPALRALTAAGITSLAAAARRDPLELAKLHGVGPKALTLLVEAISARPRSHRRTI